MTRRTHAPLFLIAALAACDVPGSVDCPAIATPALVVTVVDAQSDANITGSATATATDGAFRDSLRAYGNTGTITRPVFTSKVLWQRAGTYRLDVTAPGYAPFARTGIRVRARTCGPETVEVTARLAPSAGA